MYVLVAIMRKRLRLEASLYQILSSAGFGEMVAGCSLISTPLRKELAVAEAASAAAVSRVRPRRSRARLVYHERAVAEF